MAGANGHIDIIRHVFKYIESNSRFNKEKMLNQQNCDGNTPLRTYKLEHRLGGCEWPKRGGPTVPRERSQRQHQEQLQSYTTR
jgi:hypothetical protein